MNRAYGLKKASFAAAVILAAATVSAPSWLYPAEKPEADASFQKGQQYSRDHTYHEACAHLKKAFEADRENQTYKKAYARALQELGIETLAQEDHDRALEYLSLAQSLGSKKDDKLEFMMWLCRNHKLYKGTKPEYVHRIVALFFRHTDATVTDFNDKPFHVTADITDAQIRDSEVTHRLFRMITETFTKGRLSLAIDTVVIDDPVTVITCSKRPARKRVVYKPDLNCLPRAGAIIADRYRDTDTFFFFWASGTLATLSMGGSKWLPVIPYTLKTPLRGFVILGGKHTHWTWYSGAYLHEFGHVVESFRVGRTHALYPKRIEETRKLYPDFTGRTEAEWWKYLYESRIPARMEAASRERRGLTPPYRNLNFCLRKKDDSVKKRYEQGLPFLNLVTRDVLKKARELYDAAARSKKIGDFENAKKLCGEMNGLGPSIAPMYEAVQLNKCCRILNPDYKKKGMCK